MLNPRSSTSTLYMSYWRWYILVYVLHTQEFTTILPVK